MRCNIKVKELPDKCPKCGSILEKGSFRGPKKIKCINKDCDYERGATKK